MRFLPREEEFFDLFLEVATRGHKAAAHLKALFTGGGTTAAFHVESIKQLEHEADDVTREVLQRLDRTFITPIDREDIHLLISDLDDVVDMMDGIARRAQIFRLGEAPAGIAELCGVIERVTAVTLQAVSGLRTHKSVIELCAEAKRLEREGDAIYHEYLGRLFDQVSDPIKLIKWKDIFDSLERTIDDCEDVANDLESISLKHS